MDFAAARGIADAVFYEGYLLYPYTATSHKNRMRWQFGVIVPQAQEAAGTGEYGHQQTEVLFESAGDVRIEVLFRFLQVQARTMEAREAAAERALREAAAERALPDLARGEHAPRGGGESPADLCAPGEAQRFAPVESLVAGGTRYLSFDESLEREIAVTFRPAQGSRREVAFDFAGDRQVEELLDAGTVVGRVVRERWPLRGVLAISSEPLSSTREAAGTQVARLRVRVENTSAVVAAAQRGVVMRTAFVSAHTLIGISGGALWSPIDSPDAGLAQAAAPVNLHTWPVLVGDAAADEQRATIVLSSPIVLADFPQIAKNTNADAFDGTEIDELLNLSVLSLSDPERAEACATDPRARAIVERAEAFGAADIARTHAQFAPDPVRPRADVDEVPVFGSPESRETLAPPAFIEIDGVAITRGSSVRLAPKRRADAWDMFLAGKIATVQAIQQDFEDKIYVTVTVDDDPATEYHQWYGRSFFFEPDEVEPAGASA